MKKKGALYHEIFISSPLKKKQRRLSKIDILFKEIAERFEKFPSIEYFPPENSSFPVWRLSISGWHIHHSSSTHGSFFADAETLEEAAKKLLSFYAFQVKEGEDCKKGCPHYSSDLY